MIMIKFEWHCIQIQTLRKPMKDIENRYNPIGLGTIRRKAAGKQ